ncbi:MAG: metallophosphoesterase [Leptospiraceae bacterium]|nr:metallophosphoesterase [Leptospiraceae bacterium]
MNFYWNAFSPSNLLIDFSLLALNLLGFAFLYYTKKSLFASRTILNSMKMASLFLLPGIIPAFLPGPSPFLRIHILWTTASVFLPLILFFLFFRDKRKSFLALSILIVFFKLYAEYWEPNDLDVERISFKSNKVQQPIRITHISDLQTDGIREMHLRAREISNQFYPHLILFTGDVMNHISIQKIVEDYLSGFQKIHSAYFVTGNVDGILDAKQFSNHIGFRYFDNQSEEILIEKTHLGLIGLGVFDFNKEDLIRELSRPLSEERFRILFSHYPDSVLHTEKSSVDLILAGHTHGGQVCFPFLGPLITFSEVPNSIAAGGLNFHRDIRILVSRGLGVEGHVAPRIRILNKPHLILLEILPE